jgi:hypothetical protein
MRSIFVQDLSGPKHLSDITSSSAGHSQFDMQVKRHRSTICRHAGWYVFMAAVFCLFGSSLAKASTYYLSPYGSDSNSGQSASAAWISPNHSLNCGDTIVATPSTEYSASNFYTGKWGNVNCPAGNSVAWLTCATFDGCKIDTSSNMGMWVDTSYWGVQGWEVTTSASDTYGTCFIAEPKWSSPVEIHHIVFANDVANGCAQSGFSTVNHGSIGVDYFTVIGSIAYNAVQGNHSCTSGISVYQPIQSDSAAGTHIYIAGNFAYGNMEPSECAGGSPTDGEGITFDTFDGSQGGLRSPYAAQAVAANNILVGNGGRGIEVFNNAAGSSNAPIYVKQNTSWGNLTDPHQSGVGCGDVEVKVSKDVQLSNNLISTRSATGCGGHPIYSVDVSQGDGSDSLVGDALYGYSGYNVFSWDSGSFAFNSSNNQIGVYPNFTNPVTPGAPQCGGTGNVPSCMASVISDFVPKTSSLQGLGYQKPSSGSVHDPLFPRWLCTANVPSGLITMGCS